jgi:type III pantothenate kinase
MKLLIDIGNTASKFGVSSNGELLYLGRMYNKDINYDSIRELTKDVIDVEDILISSVAPKIFVTLSKILIDFYQIIPRSIVIDEDDDFIKIDNKNELGEDLYADIIAAREIYGPKTAVVDFGTATKILFIDQNNVFSSCAIFLGYEKSKNILANSTELLPDVSNIKIKPISDCHNTVDVINSSAYYSQLFTVKGLIKKYEDEVGYKVNVVITGGNSIDFLHEFSKEHYDEYLLLKGLNIISERR